MAFHVIGDEDTILGYRFAGVGGSAVRTEDEALAAFRERIASEDCKVLIVTETVARMIDADLANHRLTAQAPFVVEVGDVWETPGRSRSLEEMIQEAVGIKIVREKEE